MIRVYNKSAPYRNELAFNRLLLGGDAFQRKKEHINIVNICSDSYSINFIFVNTTKRFYD